MRSLTVLLAIATASMLSSASLAEGMHDPTELAIHIFEMTDRDESGSLSAEEFEAAELARYGLEFEAFDDDGDGEASRSEYLEIFMRHHPAADRFEI